MLKKIRDLKIPVKLAICFIIIGCIGASGGIVGGIIRSRLIQNNKTLYQEHIVPMSYLNQLRGELFELHLATEKITVKQAVEAEDIKHAKNILANISDNYRKFKAADNGHTDTQRFDQLIEQYKPWIEGITGGGLERNREEYVNADERRLVEIRDELDNEVYQLVNQKLDHAYKLIEFNEKSSDKNSNIMMLIVAFGVLAVILLGYLLTKNICVPLYKMVNAANSLANGDIDVDIKVNSKDEVGVLAEAFKQIILSLNSLTKDTTTLFQAALDGRLAYRVDAKRHKGEYKNIIDGINKTLDAAIEPIKEAAKVLKDMSEGNLTGRLQGDYKGEHAEIKGALNHTIEALSFNISEINNASGQLLVSSNHVAQGSQNLSQGATEQASAIEELTSTIAHIAKQTKGNAENASKANEIALNVQQNAEKGNEYMKNMLESMEEIGTASGNISKIIKVIDEIAFQTNILSLNAAVEAARAGKQGKGFAVVAEEVRNLAARSAEAAKETAALIEDSNIKVNKGMTIARETAEALHEIYDGTRLSTDLMGDISVASDEQASAIVQIDQGIEQLSLVVQANSATAEESAAASEELTGQADLMKKMVEKFQLRSELQNSDNPRQGHPSLFNQNNGGKGEKKIISDKEFGKY